MHNKKKNSMAHIAFRWWCGHNILSKLKGEQRIIRIRERWPDSDFTKERVYNYDKEREQIEKGDKNMRRDMEE